MSQHWNYLSATPPAGLDSSVVKACYQFDGPTLGLTDRTGNGHTLTMAHASDAGHAWLPMKAAFGCNAHLVAYAGSWLASAPSALLGTLGAATLEFVLMRYYIGSLDDAYNGYVSIAGDSEAETDNVVFCVCGQSTRNRIGIFVERLGGANVATWSPGYWIMGLSGAMTYFAVTREADGVTYKLYSDGVYREDIVLSDAPTGGTDISVFLGSITGSTQNSGGLGAYQSVRWSHARMTAAQIEETYLAMRLAA